MTPTRLSTRLTPRWLALLALGAGLLSAITARAVADARYTPELAG